MRRFAFFASLAACTGAPAPIAPTDAPPAPVAPDTPPVSRVGVADSGLGELLFEHWEATMQRSPLWATSLGDPRYMDRLGDPSPAAREAWQQQQRDWLARAQALDSSAYSDADRLTHRLFVEGLAHDVAGQACRSHAWSVSPRANPYTHYSDLHENLKVTDGTRAAAQLARLRQVPAVFDASAADLRAGAKEGLVANAASVQLVIDQLDREMAKDLMELPLYKIVSEATLPEDEQVEFRENVRDVIQHQILPAVTRYRDTLRDEILPVARPAGKEGLNALPNGAECYGALVQRYTTLPTATADERHQAGLDALKGIHDEFRVLGQKVLETDDLSEVFHRLRTDEALYFTTEQEVEDKARAALARAEAEMPKWFGRLPKDKASVVRIPAHEAPFTTIAYYKRPDAENSGRYFVNTYAPTTRPRHEAEVLAYHEAIPGHHLQIAIAQELPELPAFRRYQGMTAFVEGWALYTERLSDEMGLYTGDTDRLGMLSFDAWRAARLVVDTGIHHKGWSRQEAVAFLMENTPLAANNVANEVDRYITTPGQALAYKTGQQEVWALRRQAESALGDRFDIKAFHDVVLGAGAVSLPVLRERVEQWIASQTTP